MSPAYKFDTTIQPTGYKGNYVQINHLGANPAQWQRMIRPVAPDIDDQVSAYSNARLMCNYFLAQEWWSNQYSLYTFNMIPFRGTKGRLTVSKTFVDTLPNRVVIEDIVACAWNPPRFAMDLTYGMYPEEYAAAVYTAEAPAPNGFTAYFEFNDVVIPDDAGTWNLCMMSSYLANDGPEVSFGNVIEEYVYGADAENINDCALRVQTYAEGNLLFGAFPL